MKPLLIALLLLSIPLVAEEDTKGNRTKAAARYASVVPMRELMSDLLQQMTQDQPADKQAWLKDIMDNYFDYKEFEKLTIEAMAQIFTTDELNALADFYSKPSGKSAMKKMPTYLAATMPSVQSEVTKAIEKSKAKGSKPE